MATTGKWFLQFGKMTYTQLINSFNEEFDSLDIFILEKYMTIEEFDEITRTVQC